METDILTILENNTEWLGRDEETGNPIWGIAEEAIPDIAIEVRRLFEKDIIISKNAQEVWKHQRCGAE